MNGGTIYVSNNEQNSVPTTIKTTNGLGDAFGRVRVSNPKTIFDSKQTVSDGENSFWNTETNGTGSRTYDSTTSSSDLDVITAGDYVIRQTLQHFNYQPGKGQRILMTGILNPESDTTKSIGYIQGETTGSFLKNDGLCFESDSDTVYVSVYNNNTTPTVKVPQSEWNIDKLNGKGKSGITVDWSTTHIFDIKFEWLGVGRVVFSLNIDGKSIDVHEVNNANNLTNVYMRSPNQPVRYEIRSTGGAGSLKQICCSIQSEGGQEATGLVASVDTDGNLISIGTALELVLAIRLKDTQFDASILLERVNVLSSSGANFRWVVLFNPVINGTQNWAALPGGSLDVFYGDGSTNTVTGGLPLDSGFASNNLDSVEAFTKTNIQLGSTIDGTADVMALAIQTVSGTDNFAGGLTLRQLL